MAQGKPRAPRRDPNEPGYALLRARLSEARKAAGLTQQALALKLGRPQSFVAKYETGERFLDAIEFVAVCELIGTDSSQILEAIIHELRQ
jgi:transcriptional regulator with XRE-family HTH domain